jgi:hypothetical protein
MNDKTQTKLIEDGQALLDAVQAILELDHGGVDVDGYPMNTWIRFRDTLNKLRKNK